MNPIPRTTRLTSAAFIRDYLQTSTPVIVTDTMDDWRRRGTWNPTYFRNHLGAMEVQVYDDLFTLINIEELGDYLDRNFGKAGDARSTEYVRAYVRFKDVEFTWADRLFEALAENWGHPEFFPREDFVLPHTSPGRQVSPVHDLFPYKGLFISGRGARTRLHRDPFCTDAVLCQFHGEKQVRFYGPEYTEHLMNDGEFVDPEAIDATRFPTFASITPTYDDVLRPGEILFIPAGWFHDVTTLSDSISITWNFVHQARADAYQREVGNPLNDYDRDMLAYLGQPRGHLG